MQICAYLFCRKKRDQEKIFYMLNLAGFANSFSIVLSMIIMTALMMFLV